ncbi:hypothetical protein E4U46_006093 [Claviceps purpurea]|nr:hypothetical protein E4U46_006093 [Claviceps purpurea]
MYIGDGCISVAPEIITSIYTSLSDLHIYKETDYSTKLYISGATCPKHQVKFMHSVTPNFPLLRNLRDMPLRTRSYEIQYGPGMALSFILSFSMGFLFATVG